MSAHASAIQQLCLQCGLCCNGVLFRDVELLSQDDTAPLIAAGLNISRGKSKRILAQPCAALCADLKCRVYADRPVRCREFDCAQLRGVASGDIDTPQALRTIARARRLAGRIHKLLDRTGDADVHLPVAKRFQRTTRRMAAGFPDEEAAGAYADLTLAVHELNLLLHASFHVDAG